MTKKKQILGRGVSILLLLAFLQACLSSPGNDQAQTDHNGETKIAPTNTPFQPASVTSTYTPEVDTLPSVTSEGVFPSPTNPLDIPSPTSLSPTIASANSTSLPPTVPLDNPTSLPPEQPTAVPTITPDIPTPPPPSDPSIAIVPYSINAGGTLQIILEEFGANENVTLDIHLGSQLNNLQDSFGVTVNTNGNLTFSWTIPQHYVVGDYSILATGQTYHKKVPGYFRVR